MKLTGRWFPQIVDRDSGNLYPIYITKIVVLVSEPVRGRSRATELPYFTRVSRILSLSRRDYEVIYEEEQEEDATRSCTGEETRGSGVWQRSGGVRNCVSNH